jgi:DNA-binding ferritin-like protein
MFNLSEVVSTLFKARNIAHELHLKSKSFAEHLALEELYDSLLPLTDGFAESYQGTYGIATQSYEEFNKQFSLNAYSFIVELLDYVTTTKLLIVSSNLGSQLENIFDEIIATVSKAKYKIENLK